MDSEKVVRIECRGAALVELDHLLPFQGELKTLSEESYRKFRDEIDRDGFSEPFSIWNNAQVSEDGEIRITRYYICNGHQRRTGLLRMREEGWQIPPLPVSFVDAPDIQAAKRKVLALTSQYGEMTEKSLADYIKENDLDLADLKATMQFSALDWKDVEMQFNTAPGGGGGPGEESSDPDLYTKKIQSPVYEPKEETAPPISDLVDSTKASELIEQIESAPISEELKTLLRAAAQRHTVFRYDRIAEFYAHQNAEIQSLMENSALVIIDFEKAIENGFVALSEELAKVYKDGN